MKRIVFHRLFGVLCLTIMLGMGVMSGVAYAQQSGAVPGNTTGSVNDSEFWRSIRQGGQGLVSIPNKTAGIMIQSEGEEWRSLRNGPLSTYGGYLLALSLGAVVVFFLVRGRIKITGGRTGRAVPRFSQPERWIHWFVASLFILLGLSGLLLMFGRYVIQPIIGKSAWSAVASASLQGHNLLGPMFVVALLIMLGVYMKDNIWQKGDLTWALKGGFLSKGHPPSWKYNLGEKSWYWLLFFAGLAISTSGLLLDFPWLVERVQQLQLAHLVHAGAAVVLIAASLGHIYLGTIGVEGALDGMTYGYVDEKWAEEHHGWWAEEAMKTRGDVIEGAGETMPPEKAPAE